MEIYRGDIELLDYVFYATVERGKVYETGAFIHNYALVYALGLAQGETYTYSRQVQEPHYWEELTPLNGRIYISPGLAIQVSHRLVQWNTLRESYAFPAKLPSLGYPDWGFARVLRPGSRFRCFAFVQAPSELLGTPGLTSLSGNQSVRVRLGKFPGKARLRWQGADQITYHKGPFQSNALLNWRDLAVDPVVCDILATSLPTRLIHRAQFSEVGYYEARFSDAVYRFPTDMRFLARVPQQGKSPRKP